MLLHLNDDCLLHIFQLLSLKDQITLTDVCQHFQYLIVHYIWPRKYTHLSTQMKCLKPLSFQQQKKFFQTNKANIRKLEIVDVNNLAYVYNLKRLKERPDYIFYFGLKMTNLKELICADARIHDGYIKMLSKNCPKLEFLYLGKSLISGAYINEMKYLKIIKIADKLIKMPISMYEFEKIAL